MPQKPWRNQSLRLTYLIKKLTVFRMKAQLMNDLRMADWAHLKTEFDWVYEGEVSQPYRQTWDHASGQSALLIERGSMRVETEKGKVEAGKRQWIFPRQGPRLQSFSEDAKVLSVHFHLHWPGRQPLFEWDTALVVDAADAPQLEKQARILKRQVDRLLPGAGRNLPHARGDLKTHFLMQKGFASWLCLFADTLLRLGVMPSRLAQIDPRVLQAASILDDHALDVALDGELLAQEVALSVSQLDRLFIRQFGLTPLQYLERRRLERAMELIRSAPSNIKEICYEVGFGSLAHFSRWFRLKTGVSPRQFRREGGVLFHPPRDVMQRQARANKSRSAPS